MYSIESNLLAIREAAGLSQKEVAEKLGIELQQLLNWENEVEEIEQSYLLPLAKLLNCSMEDLAKKQKAVLDNEVTLVDKLAYLFQKQLFEEGLAEIEEFQTTYAIQRNQLWVSANLIKDYWLTISRSDCERAYYRIVVDSYERMIQLTENPTNLATYYHGLRQFYYQTKEYEKAEATVLEQFKEQISPMDNGGSYYTEMGELRLNEGKYEEAKRSLQTKLKHDLEVTSQTLNLLIENEQKNGLAQNQIQLQEDFLKLQGLYGFFNVDQVGPLLDLAWLYQKRNLEHSHILLDTVLQKVLSNRDRIEKEKQGQYTPQLFVTETRKTAFYFGTMSVTDKLIDVRESPELRNEKMQEHKVEEQKEQEYLLNWLDNYQLTASKSKDLTDLKSFHDFIETIRQKILLLT